MALNQTGVKQRPKLQIYDTISTHDEPESLSSQSVQLVDWGVSWQAPVKMISLLLSGVAVAISHHSYYHFLDKKEVSTDDTRWNMRSQQWQLRYGTAFAFLAKTFLAASISVAYQQQIWATMRAKALTISGLDATFGATRDLSAFLNGSFLFNVKIGASLAALTWLVPLSALVTPASLTVVSSVRVIPRPMTVPMVDFANTSFIYNKDNNLLNFDMNTVDNGVTPFLDRLMAGTASGHDILPMAAIAPAATYSLDFFAPAIRCDNASANVTEVVQRVIRAMPKSTMPGSEPENVPYIAFTPQMKMLSDIFEPPTTSNHTAADSAFYSTCIGSAASQALAISTSDAWCDGMSYFFGRNLASDYPPGFGAYIFVKANDDYWSCSVQDTHFKITFIATGNQQTINHPYKFESTTRPIRDSHFVHGQVMSNWLTGIAFGFSTGLVRYRTQITQTALYGVLRTNGKAMADLWKDIAEPAIPAADKALTRGLNMGQLIEELSRNLTLSYFSAPRLYSPDGVDTVVNLTTTPNIYQYNFANLAVAYGLAIVATIVSVVVGLKAMFANGVSHEISFSSILCSTRNATLDDLTIGFSLAAEPLSRKVGETKLRYGLLQNSEAETGSVKRAGFGIDGEVDTLTKGDVCY